MKEERESLSPTKNPIEQQKMDEGFLERARKRANAEALREFNSRAKKIRLNNSYSKDGLEFMFNMNWIQLEDVLKGRFEFTTDKENIIFTKTKEEK